MPLSRKTRKGSSGEGAASNRPKCTNKADFASRARRSIRHHPVPFHAFADQAGLNPASREILTCFSQIHFNSYLQVQGIQRTHGKNQSDTYMYIQYA